MITGNGLQDVSWVLPFRPYTIESFYCEVMDMDDNDLNGEMKLIKERAIDRFNHRSDKWRNKELAMAIGEVFFD